MTLRKGQQLFNGLRMKLNIDYSNLHSVLFYMTDKEFDDIMEKEE